MTRDERDAPVRALVFDVFGTLVDWRSGITEAFRASGLSDDAEELADAWRARYGPILAEVNSGARPWGNFDDLHLITLSDLLAERHLTAGLRTAFVDRPLEHGRGSPARAQLALSPGRSCEISRYKYAGLCDIGL